MVIVFGRALFAAFQRSSPMLKMIRIAILASGQGTNAQQLAGHFAEHPHAHVALVGCDRPHAGVVQRAWDLGLPVYLFSGDQLRSGAVLQELVQQRIDLVVLAGFLRLLPEGLVKAFPRRIINLHPSLLPRHGGRGMFGEHVHAAVLAAGDRESGITVHYVNERYDEGEHIAQFRCPVLPGDTPGLLAARIHGLEHTHFPQVVAACVQHLLDAAPPVPGA